MFSPIGMHKVTVKSATDQPSATPLFPAACALTAQLLSILKKRSFDRSELVKPFQSEGQVLDLNTELQTDLLLPLVLNQSRVCYESLHFYGRTSKLFKGKDVPRTAAMIDDLTRDLS